MKIELFYVQRKNGEKLFIESKDILEGDTLLFKENITSSSSSERERNKTIITFLNKYAGDLYIKETPALEIEKIPELLNRNIKEFDFSTRLFNCLNAANIQNFKEMIRYDQSERKKNRTDYGIGYGLLKLRNFGKRNLQELEKFLKEKDLSLDMDLTPYE